MSIVDFSTYQVPGVYVTENPVSVVNPVGTTPTVVAIVGPTRGFKTFVDAVTLNGTSPVTLSQFGVDPSSVVVTSASGTIYVKDTDYSLATITGTDSYHNQETMTRIGGGAITNGQTVYVSYNYTDFNYFTPQSFTTLQAVQDAYGQAINPANATIVSPVSLAALEAFNNGARTVVIVPTTDTSTATRTGLSTAYNLLLAHDEVDIIVPLPVGMTGTTGSPGDIVNVGTDLAAYLAVAAADGNFQTAIIGYDTGETVSPDVISAAINSARVMEAWPNQMSFYNGATATTIVVGGFYLAAALAGRFAANKVEQGLTQQQVVGFSGIPQAVFNTMTRSYKNQLSAAGVAVVEPSSRGGLVCRHGVTTAGGRNVLTQEMSLVRAADAMVVAIRDTLMGSGLIGSPETPTTLSTVKSIVQGVLENLAVLGVIFGYSALGVQQLSSNPTVIAVQFTYQPSYPVNYITVQFTVDTSTGSLNPVTQGAGQTSSTVGQ